MGYNNIDDRNMRGRTLKVKSALSCAPTGTFTPVGIVIILDPFLLLNLKKIYVPPTSLFAVGYVPLSYRSISFDICFIASLIKINRFKNWLLLFTTATGLRLSAAHNRLVIKKKKTFY